jgi:hypothetical protein
MFKAVGIQSEFFDILSKPAFAFICAFLSGILIFLGLGMDHFFTQSLILLLCGSVFAQAVTSSARARTQLILLGIALVCISYHGFLSLKDRGVLKLSIGQAQESYSRGKNIPFHLGAPLQLKEQNETLIWSYGLSPDLFEKKEISLSDVYQHKAIQIGGWTLNWLRNEKNDHADTVNLKVYPRSNPQQVNQITVRTGEAMTLDPATILEVRRVVEDKGTAESPYLGPAAEIVIRSQDQQYKAWHYVSAPQLDKNINVNPWVVEIESISHSPIFVFEVSKFSSPIFVLLFVFFAFMSVLSIFFGGFWWVKEGAKSNA